MRRIFEIIIILILPSLISYHLGAKNAVATKVIYKDKVKIEYRDKIVEKPIEKIVYRDRDVEKPVEKIVYKDRVVEHFKVVYKDKIIKELVEKIVYKEKLKIVYRDVEKVVEVPVEKIVYQERVVPVFSGVQIKVLPNCDAWSALDFVERHVGRLDRITRGKIINYIQHPTNLALYLGRR